MAAALLCVSLGTPARAAAPSPAEKRLPRLSPWQSKRATPFVSLATDAGFIYARPRLTLGYGAPFWSYVGLDAHWLTTNSFTQPYLGWRASLPFLDVQTGVRSVYPFDRQEMPHRDSHDESDIHLSEGGRRSTYHAMDLDVTLLAPVLHGAVFVNFHPFYVDASRNIDLYEEVSRAIIRPPFAIYNRTGYVYDFGGRLHFKGGAMLEYVVTPGRPKNVTRAGPLLLCSFDKSLDGLFAFSAVVDSPDTLGVVHGTYAFIGVLHRMATRF
jgi:hypothetical protein